MKLIPFSLAFDYGSVYIFGCNPALIDIESAIDNNSTVEYCCFPNNSGAAVFSIHDVGGWDTTEIMLNEPLELSKDTVCAVVVPIHVTNKKGVSISTIIEERVITIACGTYKLTVEQGYIRLPSSEIETDVRVWCKLWFNQTEDDIEPKILIQARI